MTTPVTTSELFTLTGVLSCTNACWVARMTKVAVNTANRETVLFITAPTMQRLFQLHLYFPLCGPTLSVISHHRQRYGKARPGQPLNPFLSCRMVKPHVRLLRGLRRCYGDWPGLDRKSVV